MERIHFIAIGGSAMHNLAIALQKKGYQVTGSDDEILEPSKSRLTRNGIHPDSIGWFPENITTEISAVVLGMHARIDNPELIKAKELNLKIFSYPEYLYEQTKNKTRVIIGGSHGKTTITSMILHVLKQNKIDCDFMVGAEVQGYDTMVNLSSETKFAVFEGDEYLSSPIDRRPKFHLYKPDIALISGIAWDHINVFPTYEIYIEQFKIFIDLIASGGKLIYAIDDPDLGKISEFSNNKISKIPYSVHPHKIMDGVTILDSGEGSWPVEIFGKHNLTNLNGAKIVCNELGISNVDFYNAISTFKGASRRLELLGKNERTSIYKDFAHSPSKLMATVNAMKEQFEYHELIACMELHTFSSLNETFLSEYKGTMDKADQAFVYFNPHTIEHKKLKPITSEQVIKAFGNKNIRVFTNSQSLLEHLKSISWENKNLLMMSSGTFDGIDLKKLSEEILMEEL